MIVSFGTINVDLITTVAKFPMPGETVKGRDYQLFPGGKGANQALSAARAGADVMLAGAVGSDGFAIAALENLVVGGVDVSLVQRSASPTGIYMIAIDPSGENLMIGANAANNDARADALRDIFAGPRGGAGLTFLTQNSLGVAEVEAAIALARAAGCRVVYNAAPAEPVSDATFFAADVVIVNEHEARTYGMRLDLPSDPPGFARGLATRFGAAVIVTLGAAGMVGCLDGRLFAARPPVAEVVDTTGAGDAFCGAFAAALDRGAPWERAALEGLSAGSLACRAHGAQSSFCDFADIAGLADELDLNQI